MLKHHVPELLAPAGSLEKLKIAVSYGADAVYLAGQKFGLREASDNFTREELIEGVQFAHARGTKVYLTLNSFLHDQELSEIPDFLRFLEDIKIDAVIISDVGTIACVAKHSALKIHLSTQASCLNSYSARIYGEMGVTRIILGREVSIENAATIKKESGLEIEMFIHGSLCMAYSGNCVISNYTRARDANRGGCAHSCRFEYQVTMPKEKHQDTFFMSSKDLNGLNLIDEFVRAGIDSLKIEGRMKGPHYLGTTCKIYSAALKQYGIEGSLSDKDVMRWQEELSKLHNRGYHYANLKSPAGTDSIYSARKQKESDYALAGIVLESVPEEYLLVEVRSPFHQGEKLEIIPFSGECQSLTADSITDIRGENCHRTRPGTLVKIPFVHGTRPYNIIRAGASS